MPTCTPVYELPYAIGSDRPCDIGDTLCSFASEVELELDRLDTIVDRVVDTIPMAQVRMTVTTTYATNPGGLTPAVVAFDTVDFDTADMVNLTANPYVIMLPRAGRYIVYGQMFGTTIGVGNSISFTAGTVAFAAYLDDASTPIYLNGSAELRYAPTTTLGVVRDISNDDISFLISSPVTPPVVTGVTFGVYWIGDLP